MMDVVYEGALLKLNPEFFDQLVKLHGTSMETWFIAGRRAAKEGLVVLAKHDTRSNWHLILAERPGGLVVESPWGINAKDGMGIFPKASGVDVPLVFPAYERKREELASDQDRVVYEGARLVFNPEFFETSIRIHLDPEMDWFSEGQRLARKGVVVRAVRKEKTENWFLIPEDGSPVTPGAWGVSSSGMGTFRMADDVDVPLVLPAPDLIDAVSLEEAQAEEREERAWSSAKFIDEKQPTEGEKVMSEAKDIMGVVAEFAGPLKDGAHLAGSSEAAELLVRTFHNFLRSRRPEWVNVLAREDLKHLQAALLAGAVKLAVFLWPGAPRAKEVREIANLALTFESAVILKPVFGHVTEFFEALVASGLHLIMDTKSGETK